MTVHSAVFDTSLETFEQDVIQASDSLPVLVDFWADWCAPCITIEPILGKVVASYAGRILLARLEVDAGDNMKLAGRYQVRGFPTIILFWQGREADRFSGMRPAAEIQSFIEQHTQITPSP